MQNIIEKLAGKIKTFNPDIQFKALEIGALDLGEKEKFYDILEHFPGSHVIGFEVDETLCDGMNASAPVGVKYYPHALGSKNENRPFYETAHQMCCSLYKPNEELLELYHNFEVASLKKETRIDTVSLDYFVEQNAIGEIDFIKIDVQGAELDIFEGGVNALKGVTFIVSEVEFIHHYEDQPLFGDVCNLLSQHDFMFHRFLGFGGRSLKPIVMNNDKNFPSQHIWSDAVFMRNVLNVHALSSDKLLKLSFFAALYGSLDVSFFALSHHDKKFATNFVDVFSD